jgi:hypothetical protein
MGFWTFVFSIAVVSIVAGVITTWIRARHGYPISDSEDGAGGNKMQTICAENEELKQRVAELTERLVVLERIATDPAERVSREIEELRRD